MKRGKIVLRPGSEGAPWDLELDGDPELAGAMFICLPAADGSYQVLVTRLEGAASPEESLRGQAGEFELKGLLDNHNRIVLR